METDPSIQPIKIDQTVVTSVLRAGMGVPMYTLLSNPVFLSRFPISPKTPHFAVPGFNWRSRGSITKLSKAADTPAAGETV
jgi:hypothetical protein